MRNILNARQLPSGGIQTTSSVDWFRNAGVRSRLCKGRVDRGRPERPFPRAFRYFFERFFQRFSRCFLREEFVVCVLRPMCAFSACSCVSSGSIAVLAEADFADWQRKVVSTMSGNPTDETPLDSKPGFARYFAVVASGVEQATAAELQRLGAVDIVPTPGGVEFVADVPTVCRCHLWLRTASRILKPLRSFAAGSAEMLYSQTRRVRWESLIRLDQTFAIHATLARNEPQQRASGPSLNWLRDTRFGALKVKDAICDRMRHELGARPNVDGKNPDVSIHAHFAGGRCTLSLDATGRSLHERGYRLPSAVAPLRETLAAAILELSGWDGIEPLFDPMCGSGTLVIEAAQRACKIAAGLRPEPFAMEAWPEFDLSALEVARREATAAEVACGARIFASDIDAAQLSTAKEQANRGGVLNSITFSVADATAVLPPTTEPGVLVVNPPYGERLGDSEELAGTYRRLGENWKRAYSGWKIAMLAGNLTLARDVGLTAARKFRLNNGGIDCRLLVFEID